MRVLSADESSSWLKRHVGRRPIHGNRQQWSIVWPEEPSTLARFLVVLATTPDWTAGAVVLNRPGMPREVELDEVCELRREYGYPTSRADLCLGVAPGHLLDDGKDENARNLSRLLASMVGGHLEGVLATKSGRLIAVVGCGTIEIVVRDKGLSGRLRTGIRSLGLDTP